MRDQGRLLAGASVLLAVTLAGCGSVSGIKVRAGGDPALVEYMLTDDSAPGWVLTPDEGDVEGDSPDCTGAPYDWPDSEVIAYASQFLDRPDETVALVLKRLDVQAVSSIDGLRGALEPCAPEGGLSAHGAMIGRVGDDSFAYQTPAADDFGEYLFSNMLIACGNLILEASSISYSRELDQAGLEALVAPVVDNMLADQDCE